MPAWHRLDTLLGEGGRALRLLTPIQAQGGF